MSYKIYLSPPHMSGREMKYIQDAFDSNWIAPVGPNIDAFEEELCRYTGSKFALAVSSGTAAIHLALKVLGVEKGDVVLCQSLTFVATANPIMYVGATPVFIGSEQATWNMCPDALEDAIRHYVRINKKPKAIIVVHLYGMPAILNEILFLCKKYNIPLIEDAAEALGSEYMGRKVGTFGDIGVFSFNGNKIITTSGGGALLSDNNVYVEKAAFFATQARNPLPYYEHSEIGYNYRMSNVCAGIGRGQLEVIGERVMQRRAVFELYLKCLDACQDPIFQQEPAGSHSNRWLTSMLLGEAAHVERVRHQLQSVGIEARPVWKPMHLQPLYGECDFFGGHVSESLFQNGLCLPSGSALSPEDTLEVCGVISKCFV